MALCFIIYNHSETYILERLIPTLLQYILNNFVYHIALKNLPRSLQFNILHFTVKITHVLNVMFTLLAGTNAILVSMETIILTTMTLVVT